MGVAVGCYYCSGHWWTSKGWSDHHARKHPLSDPYPSGTDLESLLVKKAQAGVAAESKTIPPTPVVDDFPKDESLSSTSTKEDQEDCALPAPSSLLQKIRHLPPLQRLPHPHQDIFRELVHGFLLLPLVLVAVRRHCLIVPSVFKFHVAQVLSSVLSQSPAERASLFVILFLLN